MLLLHVITSDLLLMIVVNMNVLHDIASIIIPLILKVNFTHACIKHARMITNLIQMQGW